MNYRFSLKRMLACITIVAIGATALVNATEAWSQVMFFVALLLIMSSILAAMYTGRGSYAGFSLFAGAYWLLLVPPAWGHHFADRLPTWPLSEYLYELVSHEELVAPATTQLGFPGGMARQRTVTRPSRPYFRSVAQFCWVILVGLLGGIIGIYIQATTAMAPP